MLYPAVDDVRPGHARGHRLDAGEVDPTTLVLAGAAGRWFSAPDFNGPWTFATPKLPENVEKKLRRRIQRQRGLDLRRRRHVCFRNDVDVV